MVIRQSHRRGVYIPRRLGLIWDRQGYKLSKNAYLRVMDRSTMILPNMIGRKVSSYNGKDYRRFKVTTNHVGHKVGEFILTKKIGPTIHNTKKNTKKKRKMRTI